MKKLLYSGLTALLMLFAFMGGGTAQTVSFSPAPDAGAVDAETTINITVSNPTVAPADVMWLTYSSESVAKSKAYNEFYDNKGIHCDVRMPIIKKDETVIAVAIWDDNYEPVILGYAEYTIASSGSRVTFSPAPDAGAVNAETTINITVSNPTVAAADVMWLTYPSESVAKSKAYNEFYDNKGIHCDVRMPVIKENETVIAVAIWDDNYEPVILDYAEYTLASSGPSVTFSPDPDGDPVAAGTAITITVSPTMALGDVYFKRYADLATAKSKAYNDFYNNASGVSTLANPSTNLQVTETEKAFAVAIMDADNDYAPIILGYAEYTLTGGGETPVQPTEPTVALTFKPGTGTTVAENRVILIQWNEENAQVYYKLYADLDAAKDDNDSWSDKTNLTQYTGASTAPKITPNNTVIKAAAWLTDKWDVFSYAVYTLEATVEPEPDPEVTLAFSPDNDNNVEEGASIEITATTTLEASKYLIFWQVYATEEEANNAVWTASPIGDDSRQSYAAYNKPQITAAKPVLRATALLRSPMQWIAASNIVKTYTIEQQVEREPFVISFDPEAGEVDANTSVTLSVAPALTDGFALYYQMFATKSDAEGATWPSGIADAPDWGDMTAYSATAKPTITEAKPVLRAAVWNPTTYLWESDTVAEYSIAQEEPEITFTFKPASGTRVNENDTVKIDCSSDEVVVYFMMFDTKAHAEAISDEDWQEGMTEYFEDEEDPSYPVITKAKPVIKAGYGIMDEEENLTWHFFYAEYTVKDNTPSDPTKATVRLVVNGDNCPHLTRNQYQLLLDADHQLADTYAEELKNSEIDRDLLPRLYEAANATIPEGMSANNIAAGVNLYGEASVEVEPGLYDIFLLQSFEASWLEKDIIRGVYVTDGWDRFYVDDLTLQAGLTYTIMVTFDQGGARGELILPVDLKLDAVLGESKPSCELEEMEVSLAISNIGSIDVTQYEILYIVERESKKDTTRETVNATLAAGKDTVVTFSKKCALNAGENTFIHAMVLAQGDANVEDNTGRYIAFRAESAIMPAQIKTTEMHKVKEADWILDDNNALVATQNASTPVFSSCFNFEKAGSYRLEYEYICGRYVELPNGEILVNNIDKYRIRLGKSNENWKEWPVVVADSVITGSSNYDEFTSKEVFFQITEPGDYAFCIIPEVVNDKDNLKFRDMQVTAVKDYDARFNALSVRAPRVIPQDWSNATHQLDVAIANRGLNKLENTNIVILVNGNQAATKTVTLDINEKQTLTVDVPVSGFHVGQTITFSGKIVRSEEVLSESGDLKAEVLVSENTAAFDHLTDKDFLSIDIDGLTSYAGARIGLIYPVVKTDTLTAITCGWLEMEENADINIAIQRISVNEDGAFVLGDMIYQSQVRRGLPGGLVTYDIPAFLLTPGDYFISLAQVGRTGFALAMDEHPEGGFYLHDTYEQKWTYFTEAGYPAIRAVFGSNGTLRTKDALVSAISKPIAGGIFANNEPIVVSVRNNGIEKAEIPVYVKVDNTLLEPKTVEVASYATVDLTFNADLAATNADRNILITAFTALSGDEDLSNDTLTKQVISFVPADPYRMDFESCLDFATEGFNPAWTSYSFDGSPVLPLRHVLEGEYHYVDFPGSETDLGFIAFNPLATDPSMIFYEYYNNCRPHSGQRFGASLAITNPNFSKDDWLVSPKLKMPAANTQLSMWVRSFRYLRESYEIWVSEGSGDPMEFDFVRVYPEDEYDELKAPIEKWENVVFDLSQYNGKDVHVAIRCMSPDAEMFMIDDIVIGENVANEQTQSADFRLSVYPNPVGEMMMVISPDALIKEVSIFNLSGTLMHHAAGLSTENFRYNANGLVSGMYFVRVSTDKGTAVRKFVVR